MATNKKTAVKPDYITISEYIRRKYILMEEADPQAKPVQRSAITRAIERGDIVQHMQGTMLFIDWNIYNDFIFRQYGQKTVKHN